MYTQSKAAWKINTKYLTAMYLVYQHCMTVNFTWGILYHIHSQTPHEYNWQARLSAQHVLLTHINFTLWAIKDIIEEKNTLPLIWKIQEEKEDWR